MNKEHTKKLINEFPDFWKHSENLDVSLMCFGFMHGDGWFSIIYNLCKKIQLHLNKYPEFKKDFYVEEVKEKFGGLRFYVSCEDDFISKLIQKAEKESYKTCEECGKIGKCRKIACWFSTLCDKCYSKSKEK